jgi:hypothetical protein
MFERYSEKARRAIFFARYEASNSGSSTVEAEHLLLGAVRAGGLGPAILDAMRAEIKRVSPSGTSVPASADLTVSASFKRVMSDAGREAEALGHKHIDVQHLLLGLMVEGDHSIVPGLLKKHGIDRAQILSSLAEIPPYAPVDRDSLRALVNSLPEQRLQRAKHMLEHMQTLPPIPGRPPSGVESGWLGGGGGAGWSFTRPGGPETPPGRMRQGRRSFRRMEEGAEVVETHHLREGCEITLIERFRLSEDGKTLSYTQEITGPGKSEQNTIDFEVSQEGGKNSG